MVSRCAGISYEAQERHRMSKMRLTPSARMAAGPLPRSTSFPPQTLLEGSLSCPSSHLLFQRVRFNLLVRDSSLSARRGEDSGESLL